MSAKPWQKPRVTIRDIAREAGVDPSTVTRALQGSPRVRDATREKIEAIAAELGYVPSAMARSLVTRRSGLVGLVIPDMTNPFFAPLARGIEDEAARHKLRVIIRNTEGRQDAERDAVGLLTELSVEGLLVAMARCPQSYYDGLIDAVPVIHVNRDDAPFHVCCNTASGSLALTRHLIELGHRRIGFVVGPSGPATEPKRSAYLAALKEAGLDADTSLLYAFDGSIASVDGIAEALLATPNPPSAVFAWNDVCAIALIGALKKRGLDVPKDMSIAGHDDIEFAGVIQPPLTTVRWPMYELGVESVRYLLGLRAGQGRPAPSIPAPELIVRASTAPPAANR